MSLRVALAFLFILICLTSCIPGSIYYRIPDERLSSLDNFDKGYVRELDGIRLEFSVVRSPKDYSPGQKPKPGDLSIAIRASNLRSEAWEYDLASLYVSEQDEQLTFSFYDWRDGNRTSLSSVTVPPRESVRFWGSTHRGGIEPLYRCWLHLGHFQSRDGATIAFDSVLLSYPYQPNSKN